MLEREWPGRAVYGAVVKWCFFGLTAVALAFTATESRAAELGWYLMAGAGLSHTGVDTDFWSDSSILSSDIDNKGVSYSLGSGYRFNRHFAIEVGYLQVADSVFKGVSTGDGTLWLIPDGTFNGLSQGPVSGRTEIEGFTVEGVGLWPVFDSNVLLYAKGGLFMWDSVNRYSATINAINRFNDDGGSLIGGFGAETPLWRDWHLRGELTYTTVGLSNREIVPVGFVTLGLTHPLKN